MVEEDTESEASKGRSTRNKRKRSAMRQYGFRAMQGGGVLQRYWKSVEVSIMQQ